MAKSEKNQEAGIRTSVLLKPDILRAMKYIIFVEESKNQSGIIEEALYEYIARWEKKHGPVPPQKT